MADHIRRQTREAFATLVTGLTTTGTRVFQNRVYPLQSTDLPALRIYIEEEQVETLGISFPPPQSRVITLACEGIAKATADVDDVLDQIGKEVEMALATNPPLNGLAKTCNLIAVNIEFSGEGEQPIGTILMRYEISVYTASNAPDIAL